MADGCKQTLKKIKPKFEWFNGSVGATEFEADLGQTLDEGVGN